MRFMLRLFEGWRRGRAASSGDVPPIGRPYLITPGQARRLHRMICTGEISLTAAEQRLGIDRRALARGFERLGLTRPWLDDAPAGDNISVH